MRGEDVVGRAVDDPHHPQDLLAGQRLAQRPDHGDGTGHGRLVEQVDSGVRRHFGQFGPADGQEGLVPGHDGLAVAQRRFDQFVGRMQPPDELHHHVDVVAADQSGGVGADQGAVDGGRAGLVEVGHGDPDQLKTDPGASRHVVSAGEKDLGERAAHVPASEQADAHCGSGMGVRLGAPVVGAAACTPPAGGLLRGHHQTLTAAREPIRVSGNGALRHRGGGDRPRSPGAPPRGRRPRRRRRRPAAALCCSWTPSRTRRRR